MNINDLPFSVAKHNPHDSKTLITKYNMSCTVNLATKYLKVNNRASSLKFHVCQQHEFLTSFNFYGINGHINSLQW